ncbi:MAG: pitrilysin family protein [Nitrospirota bacterium]
MFKKILLDNNIPLLLESAREVHSLCIGIWVKIGSRYEKTAANGISHFLEHMLFKGTDRRSAEDIAMEIDSLGGEINAFTSSEYTLFYIKVLDEYMEKAVDLLTDIFLNSSLPESELEKEKSIINEEINMVEDTPTDYVFELFSQNIWGDSGLGQSILGKKETIDKFTREDLINHVDKYYGTENIIVACSGSFDEDNLVDNLNRTIGSLKRNCDKKIETAPDFMSGLHIADKDLSEAHICLGLKGISYSSTERYTMHLLNTILGSGFSSRLFQNVREKRGLVYSIYSYHVSYFDTGLWAIYAGTDRKNVSEVVNITVDEMSNLSDTITDSELQRAKAQLKGNLILALESTSNMMTNIAKQEIYYKKYFQPGEIIRMVEKITLDNVKNLAKRLVSESPFALTVYGPVKESELKGSCKLLQ